MDKKYFKLAEDYLYAELSASLGVPQEKMQAFITEKVEQAEKGYAEQGYAEKGYAEKEEISAGGL